MNLERRRISKAYIVSASIRNLKGTIIITYYQTFHSNIKHFIQISIKFLILLIENFSFLILLIGMDASTQCMNLVVDHH